MTMPPSSAPRLFAMFMADWFTAAPIIGAPGATPISRDCSAGPRNRLAAPTANDADEQADDRVRGEAETRHRER